MGSSFILNAVVAQVLLHKWDTDMSEKEEEKQKTTTDPFKVLWDQKTFVFFSS